MGHLITTIINLAFIVIVVATIIGTVWLSKKYKERFAEFPWWKAGVIIAIEIVAWIVSVKLWPWIAIIGIALILIILAKKKKREDQIL
jgi:hypothetical protein